MPFSRRRFLNAAGSLALCGLAGAHPARSADGAKQVTLLHLTDTHGQLETHLEYLPDATPNLAHMGGYARIKTALDQERSRCAGACFLIDGGDELQGSGPTAWTEGEVMMEPLNALGLDVFVPGNWEPAYGPKRFLDQMKRLKAKVICYNLHDKKTGERIFPATATLVRNGVKVVFVGITDILAATRQPPPMFAGMETSRIDGLQDFVRALKEAEKPDLLVGVTHTGLTISRQMAREMPQLDVILSGHSHERTEKPIRIGDTLVVECGSMGSFFGRLDLTLKPEGGVADFQFRLIPVLASSYSEDPAMKQLVDRALAPHRERMVEVLTQTTTTILRYDVLETTADNLISDAVRQATRADIAVSNGFRFGLPVQPGPVRQADMWDLLPMDARVKVGWVTGAELRAYLENELELVYSQTPSKLSGGWGPRLSGLTMSYKAKAAAGQRLLSIQVNGQEVQPEKHYTFAGCEREGEPLDMVCRLKGTHDVKVVADSIHELMTEYCRQQAEVHPHREKRAVAVDLPERVFSQDAILSGDVQ